MAHLADMPEVAEQFIKLGDLRVRLLRAGRGPALVLIHGLLGYSFSWRHAIPILAKDREVFAIDMPGSGFSDCGDALDGHLAAAAQRLSGVLETLSIQRCDLVGSSYGGATALRFATLYPQRVRSLVLVSPANPWSRIGRKRLAAFRVPGFGQTFSKVARHLSPLHGFFIGRMYGNRALLSEQTVQGYSMVIARKGVLSHGTRITRSWREDMSELGRNAKGPSDPCAARLG